MIALSALGYAPTMRPVGQQRSAVQMQEAAGQPDAISTTGGYVEAPTALKDELGAIGPLGYWDFKLTQAAQRRLRAGRLSVV